MAGKTTTSYTNTRTGATRESGSALGFPFVKTSQIERQNRGTAKPAPADDSGSGKAGDAGDSGKAGS